LALPIPKVQARNNGGNFKEAEKEIVAHILHRLSRKGLGHDHRR
jgi:hypothetical protein